MHSFWILDRNLCYRLTYNIEHKPYAPLSACFPILIFRWESSFSELTVALILNPLHWFEAVVYFQYLAHALVVSCSSVSLCSLRPDDVTSFCLRCRRFLESRFVHLIWLLSTKRERTQPAVWETGMRETQRDFTLKMWTRERGMMGGGWEDNCCCRKVWKRERAPNQYRQAVWDQTSPRCVQGRGMTWRLWLNTEERGFHLSFVPGVIVNRSSVQVTPNYLYSVLQSAVQCSRFIICSGNYEYHLPWKLWISSALEIMDQIKHIFIEHSAQQYLD